MNSSRVRFNIIWSEQRNSTSISKQGRIFIWYFAYNLDLARVIRGYGGRPNSDIVSRLNIIK